MQSPTWSLLNPTIKKIIRTKQLTLDDYRLPDNFIDSKVLVEKSKELFRKKPDISFFRNFYRTNKKHFILVMIVVPFMSLCFAASPICIQYYQKYLSIDEFFDCSGSIAGPSVYQLQSTTALTKVLSNVAPFLVLNLVSYVLYGFLDNICCVNTITLAVKFSALTLELLFQKLYKLSEVTKNTNAQGSLMNMLYGDIYRVQMFLKFMYLMPLVVINLIISSIMIALMVDVTALVTLLGLLVMLIFSVLFASFMQKELEKTAPVRDQRSQKVQEMLNGMKVIKLFNLQQVYEYRVQNIRIKELKIIMRSNVYHSLQMSITWGAYCILSILVFGTLIGFKKLRISDAFTVVFLLLLMYDSIGFLPMMVTFMQDSMISFKRIHAFIWLPEVDRSFITKYFDSEHAILIKKQHNYAHSVDNDERVRPELDPHHFEKVHKYKLMQKYYKTVAATIGRLLRAESRSQICEHNEGNYIASKVDYGDYALHSSINAEICRYLQIPYTSFYDDIYNYSLGTFKALPKDNYEVQLFKSYLHMCVIKHHLEKKTDGDSTKAVIRDLELAIPKGQLVGVEGPIGSGKSSLFQCLLGEMRLLDKDNDDDEPFIQLGGRIAYCPQTAPIFSMTIRDNICFFKPYDEEKYNRVIEICCLLPDLQILTAGDLTEVGGKGVTLSGGYRARIALARAVYSDADIYLLDDPLSAVDPHVGKSIWTNVVLSYLKARGKTVVIASHQKQYFRDCDRVLTIKEGRISNDRTVEQEDTTSTTRMVATTTEETTIVQREYKEAGKLVKDEECASGNVTCAVYCRYMRSGSICLFILFIILVLVYGGAKQYESILITHWQTDYYGLLGNKYSDPEYERFMASIQQQLNSSEYYVHTFANLCYKKLSTAEYEEYQYTMTYYYIFVGVSVLVFVSFILFEISYYAFSVSASKKLYRMTLHSLLNTFLRFFDTTPQGRVINRLVKDCESVDILFVRFLMTTVISCVQLFGNFITLCVVSYPSLLVVIPCLIIYFVVFQRFRVVIPSLRRLESTTRSNVFNICQEYMDYLISIRAYEVEDKFLEYFRRYVSNNIKTYYYSFGMVQWIQFRFTMIGACMSALICLAACLISPFNISIAQYSGIIVSYGLSIQPIMLVIVDNLTLVESEMPAIERAMDYQSLPDEQVENCKNAIINEWKQYVSSTDAKMYISDLQMRYRPELPLALKGINVSFNKGDHVSIIGRTGSGKSSFALSLFKLYQPECNGYCVSLDDCLLNNMDLYKMRGQLAIIPYEPFLFSGTLRQQLCEYSRNKANGISTEGLSRIPDYYLWQYLDMVQLKSFIEYQPGYLDCVVLGNGENFSSGYRQLICIIRALLKGTEVIILDEATSYVDYDTDVIIQKLIQYHLKDKIVLSIAHRMETVLSMDKVLVINEGRVAEYGEKRAVYDQNGIFTQMCYHAGIYFE